MKTIVDVTIKIPFEQRFDDETFEQKARERVNSRLPKGFPKKFRVTGGGFNFQQTKNRTYDINLGLTLRGSREMVEKQENALWKAFRNIKNISIDFSQE
jgi:hypothetical protein